MKFTITMLATLIVTYTGGIKIANATPAQAFIGLYQIVEANESPVAEEEYLLLDADRLEVIWGRYADGDLPENLVPYKDEPVIIAGFTNRDFVILKFEEFSVIRGDYLRMEGADEQLFEILRLAGGGARVATRKNGIVNRYLTTMARDIPRSLLQQRELVFPSLSNSH